MKFGFRKAIFLLLILNVLYLQSVFAIGVEVSLEKEVAYPGEEIRGAIKINNSLEYDREVYIDIYALGREGWFSWDKSPFKVKSGEIEERGLLIAIPDNTKGGVYHFYVYVIDTLTKERLSSTKKAYTILEKPVLEISNLGFKHPKINSNKTQTIYVRISNIGEIDAENYALIIKIPSLGYVNTLKNIAVEKGSSIVRYVEIPLEYNTLPGTYEVVAELYDITNNIVSSKRATFEVLPTSRFIEEVKTKGNPFYEIYEYSIENRGNIKDTYVLYLDTGIFSWIYDVEGKELKKVNGKEAIVCDLNPGDRCGFKIKVNYWLLYVVGLAIITILVIIFISFTTPKLRKEYYRKGHKYNITLTVVNHKTSELKDVIIRDYVKGIFVIDENTIIPKPSNITKTKDGYVIEWKLGNLKPGEVRVIKYDITPKINIIGDVELDNAVLEARTSKGKKVRIKS